MSESPSQDSLGRRDRLLVLVPIALLLITVAIHQVNVRVNAMAPDLAGGFGMFAFADNSGWRAVIVTLQDEDGREWTFDLLAMGPQLDLSEREVQRVRGVPSDGSLAATAALIGDATWFVEPDGDTLTTRAHADARRIDVAEVRLVVHGIEYDNDQDLVRRVVLAQWPAP